MEWYEVPHNIEKSHSESRLNYINNFKSCIAEFFNDKIHDK